MKSKYYFLSEKQNVYSQTDKIIKNMFEPFDAFSHKPQFLKPPDTPDTPDFSKYTQSGPNMPPSMSFKATERRENVNISFSRSLL